MKKKNIPRKKIKNETSSVLEKVLIQCGWDLSSFMIIQMFVPPFLGETEVVMIPTESFANELSYKPLWSCSPLPHVFILVKS